MFTKSCATLSVIKCIKYAFINRNINVNEQCNDKWIAFGMSQFPKWKFSDNKIVLFYIYCAPSVKHFKWTVGRHEGSMVWPPGGAIGSTYVMQVARESVDRTVTCYDNFSWQIAQLKHIQTVLTRHRKQTDKDLTSKISVPESKLESFCFVKLNKFWKKTGNIQKVDRNEIVLN